MGNRSVRLLPEQEAALKQIALTRGSCSVNALVREAVDLLISRELKSPGV